MGTWAGGGHREGLQRRVPSGITRRTGLRSGCRECGGGLGLGLDGPESQAPGWVSLPSVQYNKFTAAGAQQLAASLRKCPNVETLA